MRKVGWLTRAEILSLNKMSEKDFSDEAEIDVTVWDVVAQAKAEFPGYEPEHANHSNTRPANIFHQKLLETSSHSVETTIGASGATHKFNLVKQVEGSVSGPPSGSCTRSCESQGASRVGASHVEGPHAGSHNHCGAYD